ncbi:MAG: amino acid adenylation domain-containing protein, partial [Chitinophagaceae bacterium]
MESALQHMSIDKFIGSLREKGITLRVDNESNLDVDAPRGVLDKPIIDEIRERKNELLDYLNTLTQNTTKDDILPAPKAACYDLSSSQMRVWITNAVLNDPIIYNIDSVTILTRPFDPFKFEQSIIAVAERHEILRTIFKEDENALIKQWVLPVKDFPFKLSYIDLRFRENNYSLLPDYIKENVSKPFDLKEAPLFRVSLYRLDEEVYYLHYTIHHILSDGWSLNVLSSDIFTFYNALENGIPATTKPLRIHYKDYAAWQQQQMSAETFKRHRQYWTEQLSGELQVLDLFPGSIRPPYQTTNGFILNTVIDAELTRRFKEFCIQHKGSLFMGLVASLRILFYRYTGLNDVIIGTPVAGRNHPDLHNQIGLYINTLALRTPIEDDVNFINLFNRVRVDVMNAFEHDEYPFDKLLEDIELKRNLNRNALVDVMMGLQNFNDNINPASVNHALKNKIEDVGPSPIRCDLLFDFQEIGSELDMRLEFNVDIYEKEAMYRLIGHFKGIVASLVDQPTAPIKQLSYLSSSEQQQLLHDFNNTETVYSTDKTIVDLFDERVKTGGGNTAIVYEGRKLSYRELDEQTNQLARYLQEWGVSKESLVPVCLDRSPELIISMLAVLKAGGAYVPIDPSYPVERISFMLNDLRSDLIITHSYFNDLFEDHGDLKKICIDRDWIMTEQFSTEKIQSILSPGNLAYVIYTSGSTGNPKGVMIEHTSVVNLIEWHSKRYEASADSRSTAMAGISFDAFALETWSALLCGATLYIVPDVVKLERDLLMDFLNENAITHTFIPPALIPGLVNGPQPASLSLKYILIGGDRLPALDVEQLSYTLVNQYGPTECTVMVTDFLLLKNEHTGKLPAIGKPLANSVIYILDSQQQLVPVGVSGELYIGGVQLARGYLHNDDLTEKKFIEDPFKEGQRLYRTGDTARWLPHGNIEYLGRIDEQVKIRGFRVEPGEVEHALQQFKEITGAIVMAHTGNDGHQVLAGYFTSDQEQPVHVIRQQLLEKLPDYMVPAYLVQVEEFQLTPNGKIDRKALPHPEDMETVNGVEYQSPRNELDKKIVEIWQEILGRSVIG